MRGFVVERDEKTGDVLLVGAKLKVRMRPNAAKMLAARLLVASEADLEGIALGAKGAVEDTLSLARAVEALHKRFLPSGQ